MKIIIGTRGSKLALYQANKVKRKLEKAHEGIEVAIQVIKTKGDKILDVALSKIGDKGLFTKELEVELLNGNVDICVHSLKDLPTVFPEGTQLGAVLKRGQNKDVFISRKNILIEDFTPQMTIATSSLRRKAQLLRWNQELNIVDIRGNVDTRMQKLKNGYCDALLMAGAGIERMGYEEEITQYFNESFMIPAPGQGAIAIETRLDDGDVLNLIQPLHHQKSFIKVSAERAFLNALEGGCQIPIGCSAIIKHNELKLAGFVASVDGKEMVKDFISGSINESDKLGRELAEKIMNNGGASILEKIRKQQL